MKRIVQIALLSVAATTLAFGQSSKSTDEQTILKLENDWAVALVKADVATFDRIEAPEYLFTAPDGSLTNKADSIAEMKNGVVKIAAFKIDDLKVKIFGDAAVVYGLDTEKSTYNGKDTSGQYRFTDFFVKRNGIWQAVATHVSMVEKH